MTTTKRSAIWKLLFLAGVVMASNAAAFDQGWMVNGVSVSATDKMTVTLNQENRFSTFSYYDNRYLSNYQVSFSYELDSNFYAAAGFRRQDEEKSSYTSHENRIFVEGGWKTRLAGPLQFDARLMIESRNYEQSFIDDFFRYRIRERVTWKTSAGPVRLSPFIGLEQFFDNREQSEAFLNRHRVYLGAKAALSGRVSFSSYYMLQNDTGRKAMSALVSGFQISL